MTAIITTCKFTVFSSGSFCQIYRVTDEALIAETMVWPNFFHINVFFALKGSAPFIIIYLPGGNLTLTWQAHICLSRPGLEPMTAGLGGQRSNH